MIVDAVLNQRRLKKNNMLADTVKYRPEGGCGGLGWGVGVKKLYSCLKSQTSVLLLVQKCVQIEYMQCTTEYMDGILCILSKG